MNESKSVPSRSHHARRDRPRSFADRFPIPLTSVLPRVGADPPDQPIGSSARAHPVARQLIRAQSWMMLCTGETIGSPGSAPTSAMIPDTVGRNASIDS